MAVNASYREWVLGQLGEVVPVRGKSMFGCVGVYSDDLFFAIIDDGVVYFKVDDSNRADFEESGMEPFAPYENKSRAMPFYQVPEEVLEEPEVLHGWVEKSLMVAANGRGGAA
jgi:DNA transformation protein